MAMKIPKTESKTVEFKSTFNQDVLVSLVAFANADGGDVYVGVRDDGNVVGVQLAAESETTWINEIKSKTAPAIVPEADRIAVGKKTVVRLHIAPLPVKPTSVQGRYYIRKAKSNHLMSLAELSDLYLKAAGDSWDALPNRRGLDVISLEKVALFAKRMNPDNPDDPLRVLRKLSLIRDGHPTNACYLAFAEDYCQETAFQTGRFKTRSHIIDDRTFNADLLGELDGVMAFVKNHLMAELVITGKPEHDVRYDYPMEAIREIVLNMLVHRDYCGAGVNTIKIFDDHMEFTNPGGLPHGLTVNDLLSDAYVTSPRNPQLASLFKAVGLTERYGSGIRRIADACRRHGGVRVEFENHETWFKVILSKVNCEKGTGESSQKKLGEKLGEKLGGKLGENRRRIIMMMEQDPSVTTFDLAAGIGISQTAIENNITWLRLHGYIRRVGPKKGGHWEVVER